MSNQFHQKATAAQQRAQQQKQALVANQKTFGAMLESRRGAIEAVIPKHISAERLFSVAMVAVNKTPALLECHIPSVVSAVHHCVSLGFEPNNALGQAYIVPFRNNKENRKEAQVIIGYKGFAALMRRSGDISFFDGQVVYDCDRFDFEYGTHEKLLHKPALNRPSDAKIIGAYSVARLKDSQEINFRVVGMDYLEQVRDDVRNKNFGKSPVWDQHPEPMMIKTAMRSHAKYLPLSIEMNSVLELDNQAAGGMSQNTGIYDDVIDLQPMPDSGVEQESVIERAAADTADQQAAQQTQETATQATKTTAQDLPEGVAPGSEEVEI